LTGIVLAERLRNQPLKNFIHQLRYLLKPEVIQSPVEGNGTRLCYLLFFMLQVVIPFEKYTDCTSTCANELWVIDLSVVNFF
jgi:hypothetical protein